MKKVLIWDSFPLQNTGGPNGYLYNIHEYLKLYKNEQIVFLSDLMVEFHDSNLAHNNEQHTQGKKSFYVLRTFINYFWRIYRLCNVDVPSTIDLNKFDYIHVHSINEVMGIRKKYPYFKGKLIVTSHCPCLWIDEMLKILPKWAKIVRPIAIINECLEYKNADYIMFPCKEAREPYEKNLLIRRTFSKNENKFFYVPSSIMDIEIDDNKIQRFSDLGIPQNSFVITYFGRHNHIKGYDILKELGMRLLDKYPNLYFLCAGRGDITPPNHARWIELGFINNAHELLHQSDLYVLPNRETYFDLIVLEIMRSGTKLILSDTGGNKYFAPYIENGFLDFSYFDINDFDGLIEIVESSIKSKIDNPKMYMENSQKNRIVFNKHFTPCRYIEEYVGKINLLN